MLLKGVAVEELFLLSHFHPKHLETGQQKRRPDTGKTQLENLEKAGPKLLLPHETLIFSGLAQIFSSNEQPDWSRVEWCCMLKAENFKLESGCSLGPNAPRKFSKLRLLEASTVLSKRYTPNSNPVQDTSRGTLSPEAKLRHDFLLVLKLYPLLI